MNNRLTDQTTGNCWLFHRWAPWQQYIWHGYVIPRWGKAAGQHIECEQRRQKRQCKGCGKEEDVLV